MYFEGSHYHLQIPYIMLEKIIKRKYYLEHHHLNAPLLAEREAYLTAMYNRGLSHGMLLSTADYLLRIIEFLDLRDDTPLRKVSIGEIESAGDRWARTIKNHPMKRQVAETAKEKFILTAVNWLGPLGKIERYSPEDNILSGLFSRCYHKRRYLTAPFLEERISYLMLWKERGAAQITLRQIASYQLHIIDYLHFTERRSVKESAVVRAAEEWERAIIPEIRKKSGRKENKMAFIRVASGWLGWMGLYVPEPDTPAQYDFIRRYLDHLVQEKGYSERTAETRDSILKIFFRYLEAKSLLLENVTVGTIDCYLEKRSTDGCCRRSIAGNASVLRDFFRYAEEQGWCEHGVRSSIRSPRCYKMESVPSFITWDQVRTMLDNQDDESPRGILDHAILQLLSVYGLRSSEVADLKLSDIDWRREVIHLRRSKGCRPQEMPLVKNVGESIIRYLKEVRRNEGRCEYVFICLRSPYQKMNTSSIYKIVRDELVKYDLNVKHRGPHTLRHSCATHLVNSGHSMKEVADLLGHQMLDTTSIYAKVDLVGLRKVADMEWEGLI